MKKIIILLCAAVAVSGLAAQDVKVAPTQAVVDYLVSRGADAAAIQAAKADATSGALFLAPGAISKEAMGEILAIANKEPLDSSDPEYIALGYDPRERLDDLVFSELNRHLPVDGTDYTTYSMQIGNVVWSVGHSQPE